MAASRAWVGICTRTDGCILHARHAGACKVGDVGEEDYEVESILDQRGAGRALKYLLKWKGWPAEDSTWEPKSALADCPDVFFPRSLRTPWELGEKRLMCRPDNINVREARPGWSPFLLPAKPSDGFEPPTLCLLSICSTD